MKPDAIIVPHGPAGRSLSPAQGIAAALGCALVVIPGRTVAGARNLGLDVAARQGWRKIMFLDDDIIIGAGQVSAAAELLRDRPAAAFTVGEFPDRSVIRHADPDPPPPRPGGGALLLNLDWPHGRFPAMYNDDWFFLWRYASQGGVADAGTCSQLPYDPFIPARAAREELGDLVAENLYGPRLGWAEAIRARHGLHDRVARACPPRARQALRAGRDVLCRVTPLAAERAADAATRLSR